MYIYIREICDFPLPRLITKGYQEWEHPEANFRDHLGSSQGCPQQRPRLHGPADNFHMSIVHIMDDHGCKKYCSELWYSMFKCCKKYCSELWYSMFKCCKTYCSELWYSMFKCCKKILFRALVFNVQMLQKNIVQSFDIQCSNVAKNIVQSFGIQCSNLGILMNFGVMGPQKNAKNKHSWQLNSCRADRHCPSWGTSRILLASCSWLESQLLHWSGYRHHFLGMTWKDSNRKLLKYHTQVVHPPKLVSPPMFRNSRK